MIYDIQIKLFISYDNKIEEKKNESETKYINEYKIIFDNSIIIDTMTIKKFLLNFIQELLFYIKPKK